MNTLERIARLFLPQREDFRALSVSFPDLETQAERIWARNTAQRAWRRASVNEALGVPAILSAVSLISGTVGSLSLEAFQNGMLITDQAQQPRLIIRPNPRATPREFFRDSAFYLATRGEVWWYVAKRDGDGAPQSLVVIPPWEVQVERNDRDRLNPTIRWLDKVRRIEDMRQITYLPDTTGLRGVGPLQLAGAAVSVTVEADQWAANFFSGSLPSVVGKTALDLDENDLKELDKQWSEKANNLPRWLTNDMELQEPPYNAQKAQLNESRQHQVGEVARMFNMPGSLIEYQMSGSSLRYQNDETVWADFQRRCLSPHYLEPIEQEMSDLLTRSTAARFNTDQLLRASVKTRWEVYEMAASVLGMDEAAQYARRHEGLAPGNVDYAPVPPGLPAAMPSPIRARLSTQGHEVRCPNGHLLAEMASPPYRFTCFRCKTPVAA